MRTISLIRHGQSTHRDNRRMTCREFTEWVNAYNHAGVINVDSYPAGTTPSLTSNPFIVTSHIRRAVDSADCLYPSASKMPLSLFRETELPIPRTNVCGIKLRASTWSILLRIAWFAGYSSGCESFKEAKQRAEAGAKKLVEYAEEHRAVVLIGHGFFNQLLAAELRKMGWTGQRRTNAKNWQSTIYSFYGYEKKEEQSCP